MARYLLFTLAAPLASFGAIAVGERRPTWSRPSKSQVIGLIAAAAGVERADDHAQARLAAGLGFAVRTDCPGTLATDYHTAQSAPARRNRTFATRADELSVPKTELKTILSRREFRVGPIHTVAVWRDCPGEPAVETIVAALRAPTFTPYAGRKAFPLMLPMRPSLIEADDIQSAFTAYDVGEPKAVGQLRARLGLVHQGDRPIFADAAAVPRQLRERLEERRDEPESRTKWRFGLRAEALIRTSGGSR